MSTALFRLVRQDRLVFDEIPTQIHKLQLSFASLHHLGYRRDIRLIKDEYTTQQFATSYLMAMKIDLWKWRIFIGYKYLITDYFKTLFVHVKVKDLAILGLDAEY